MRFHGCFHGTFPSSLQALRRVRGVRSARSRIFDTFIPEDVREEPQEDGRGEHLIMPEDDILGIMEKGSRRC
jgi:hypothetical protein